MIPGYNTNGFSYHDLSDALSILSELGYASAAITLERGVFDPPGQPGVPKCIKHIGQFVESLDLRVTVETGSRFILDPRRKHQPTLLSKRPEERLRRVQFIKGAIDVAEGLSADSVSLWSGAPDDGAGQDQLWNRLTGSLADVLDHAESKSVRLAFEPEPGMFIDSMERFARLFDLVDHPLFGLTLDVGHVHCLGDGDVGDHINRWRDQLWNVHLEDMLPGVHQHLMFGQGSVDFVAVFAALCGIDYCGPLHVELSRHSHNAVEVARESFAFLSPFLRQRHA